MREWGFTIPVLADENGGIIAGHGRVMAAELNKYTEAPVMVARGWSEAQKRAYVIADNKLALNAGWNEQLLSAALVDLRDLGTNLNLIGFSDDELAGIFARADSGLTNPDDIPPAPAEPVSRVSDVWLLGRHRLLCGDATRREDVERVMGRARADMVFTDPPYGISAVKMTKSGGTVGNSGGTPFGGGGRGHAAKAIITPKWYAPVIGDDSTATAINAYRLCADLEIPALIFWGANYYAHALPPSRCWIVWDKENTGNFADCELAWTNLDRPARLFRHMWSGLMKASERGESRVHPTQKPVALAVWAFCEFIAGGATVLDPFLGSGSTLIACEKTNRTCIGMELSPAYCDVIVKRWQTYTGQQATRERDGKLFDELEPVRT